MIFIDFGLLRSLYRKISDLLAEIKIGAYVLKFDNLRDYVCEDNS